MYTARFFSTQFGRVALISIVAMAALNVAVLTRPASVAASQVVASSAAVTGELA